MCVCNWNTTKGVVLMWSICSHANTCHKHAILIQWKIRCDSQEQGYIGLVSGYFIWNKWSVHESSISEAAPENVHNFYIVFPQELLYRANHNFGDFQRISKRNFNREPNHISVILKVFIYLINLQWRRTMPTSYVIMNQLRHNDWLVLSPTFIVRAKNSML